MMSLPDRQGEIRVAFYTRGELPPPAEAQADILHERLSRLHDSGVIDDVCRDTWIKRTPVSTCPDQLRDTYLEFSDWATETGRTLVPYFRTRECFSTAHRERVDYLELPALCMAVYEDGDLSAVYPHSSDDASETVWDGLERLEGALAEDIDRQPVMAD